ncbi:MAG: precorrin-2 C(20)-methyltransferase [Clostridiales bacterium]|nr:precorrin-2 C(20)-methyltransferase [Bacillota bacterium]MEE0517642.1 precorrin-2 C(20)-methyltransferase [Anaerovoracaceae bacterium]PWL93432.1 MAG: precorrin-2 C(20)-methyltransferase [Clostridiales bacterium]
MRGKLYGVGVSIGEPELMTFKAADIIKKCDVIAVPGIDRERSAAWKSAKKLITEIEQKPVLCIEMPMTKDRKVLDEYHSKASKVIETELEEGRNVAFLTIGDPCVYATYMYVHRIVERDGFEAHIVNGITSFCAAAARADISLCEEDEQLHIIPASYGVEEALKYPGTRVFMKSGAGLSETIRDIEKTAKEDDIQVYMVENCGMENEKIYIGIESIKQKDMKDISYFTTIIVKENKHD